MMEWQISNQNIQTVEKLLLPHGAHFSEDAIKVIRCWHSTDVAACPGSGKTTVLLAKLKLLADKMPLEKGAGICVLSHTNVAVNEIKNRLSDSADRLLAYPNYIGTIQSFIDRFVTMPYLRNISRQNIQVVDSLAYAQYMLNKIQHNVKYKALDYVTKYNFETGGQFSERINHTQALYIRDDGALCVGKQRRPLAGAEKASTKQYKELLTELLNDEGIIRYQDAYAYARTAINELPTAYTDLFSSRFQYVFVDEYQDCDDIQRQVIASIFDSTKCTIFKIGDSDQAIYNSDENTTPDWIPQPNFLPIRTSCRFSQEIANVLSKLKKDNTDIITLTGETGVKPVLLIFSPETIDRVIYGFISELEAHGLYDNNGIYKAIGAIKKVDSSGLKIGSYWAKFDSSSNRKNENNYWTLVDEIIQSLSDGRLYTAEQTVRKLLCRVFHHVSIIHSSSGKEYTLSTLKKTLDEKYSEPYRQWIYEMSRMPIIDRHSIDQMVRQRINDLLRINNPNLIDIFDKLPVHFLNGHIVIDHPSIPEKNILIDPIRGRRIVFDTIHRVKGETHDATLYLETDRHGASDLKRILPYFGVGHCGSAKLYDYSRKLAYVGMSRPQKLLCVAMQEKTYRQSNGAFDDDWKIVDLTDC